MLEPRFHQCVPATLLVALLGVGCVTPEPLVGVETLNTAEALGNKIIAQADFSDASLDLEHAALAYGLERLAAATDEDIYRATVSDWIGSRINDGTAFPIQSSDELVSAALASSMLRQDDSLRMQALLDAADLYLDHSPRSSGGAIFQWAPEHEPMGDLRHVWVSGGFGFGLFLARELERTGSLQYGELFLEQYAALSAHCRDDRDELYRHAWDDERLTNIPEEALYWARGNGWLLAGSAEAVRALRGAGLSEPTFEAQVARHANALIAHQTENGLWRTALTHPSGPDNENYTETAGSALIGYGLLVLMEEGLLEQERVRRVLEPLTQGLLARVHEGESGDIHLSGTSWATLPGDYDSYVRVAQVEDDFIGLGTVTAFLAELDGATIQGVQ